jgi:thymidylate synthase (FAD)
MNVRIISITQPLIDGITTAEELIVHNARVSNPSNQLNTLTGPKLLAYCIGHGHWSVFEQADMTVEIKTSRAIAAQILRHRSFSYQEFSQRYADATGIEPIELRKQAESNRQSSTEVMYDEENMSLVYKAQKTCEFVYQQLLEAGVARECARMVLPLATSTTLYMKGSVRSWIHYLSVRCDDHTQKEHRLIAEEIREIFGKWFPVTAAALKEVEK